MADSRLKEAQFCIAEASALFPNSHSVLLQRGCLAELRGQLDEAKGLYDEALAIHPTGENILVHMVRGRMLFRLINELGTNAHHAWIHYSKSFASEFKVVKAREGSHAHYL